MLILEQEAMVARWTGIDDLPTQVLRAVNPWSLAHFGDISAWRSGTEAVIATLSGPVSLRGTGTDQGHLGASLSVPVVRAVCTDGMLLLLQGVLVSIWQAY